MILQHYFRALQRPADLALVASTRPGFKTRMEIPNLIFDPGLNYPQSAIYIPSSINTVSNTLIENIPTVILGISVLRYIGR